MPFLNKQKYILKLLSLCGLVFITAACTTSESRSSSLANERERLSPNSSAELNVRLAIDYLKQKNIPMAKVSLLKAKQDAPKSAAVWYAMGYFDEVTGDAAKAEEDYERAIQFAPKSGNAHNNYGTFLCRHGRYRESVEQFSVATSIPDYLDVSGAYENAGLCATLIPDRKMAMSFFLKAVSNDPNHPTSLLELAKLYYEQGDFQKSRNYLTEFNTLSKPTPESEQLEAQLNGEPHV